MAMFLNWLLIFQEQLQTLLPICQVLLQTYRMLSQHSMIV